MAATTQKLLLGWVPSSAKKRREALWGFLFVLPMILGFLIFQIGPMIYSIRVSFHDWDALRPPEYVGLENYEKALYNDRLVPIAFENTLYLMQGIPIGMALSLMLAMAMNRNIRGISIFRTFYFLPVISSVVATSILWKWIFNPNFGMLNALLSYIGIDGPLWLGDEDWSKPALIIMGVWGGLGFNMLLYLAALQNVPRELLEAATIDGAGVWDRFRHITWPMLTPTTFFILVTSIIGTFQVFAQIHLMTRAAGPSSIGGGPHWSTLTVIYYIWLNGFNYFEMGYAAAIAWILAAAIMVFTVVQFVLSRRWVYYNE